MNTELQKNQEWIEKNREKFLNLYLDKYILVVGQKVISSFDEYQKAVDFAIENYGLESNFYVEYMNPNVPANFVFCAIL